MRGTTMSANRTPSSGVSPWGPGFDRLGLPQNGRKSLPWWIGQSHLPFLRDDT
jgi:hypothetical protein